MPSPPDASREPTPPLLYTVQQAAELLQVPISWLRKKAAARAIPCTFVGKHLRFSHADLDAIVASGAQTPAARPRRSAPRRQP
ncbi:helix-turn-helix domain-containing protein [Phytohabitans suffuscus]|uniref:Helix-turn-helix domain-containing protein n=1 Tax=Phytohabitans suffuscus TaxID=624315 RepID=A0A6F8YC72_9ACTN|nr:helix-turn-helix domain-containing protein [Phytohabitans suffuscus]BCB83660.1 hypothetical protein Psuf_009730 [Phytohabitans suffuscus]